ncbi:flagellar attachment zone protein 1-like [Mytilus edulis]|uniref:flagellar attachment zone protein 1-like n=1 Tax=Mytilus edulis TaxID=6550 RepID=UPI0039EF6FB7
MNQEMKELSMDEDNAIFERNLGGFILSVLHAACSETESDAVSVQQTLYTDTASEEERVAFFGNARTKEFERLAATMKEQNAEAENTETASEEERVAFFGNARTKEFERLAATMKEKNAEGNDTNTASEEERVAFFGNARTKEFERLAATMKEQNAEGNDTNTASEEERVAFFGNDRINEIDRLMSTMNTQVDKVENQDVQSKPIIITKEILSNQVETEALDTEETASEGDRVAFFQSVRDAERQKLIEAFARENQSTEY